MVLSVTTSEAVTSEASIGKDRSDQLTPPLLVRYARASVVAPEGASTTHPPLELVKDVMSRPAGSETEGVDAQPLPESLKTARDPPPAVVLLTVVKRPVASTRGRPTTMVVDGR
jgi:hypothetical protein